MKKLLLAGMLLFNVVVFAQSQKWEPAEELSPNATTDKEYNYLTVGLKNQLANGYDTIDGYLLQNCMNQKISNYNFDIKFLVDKNTDKLKALSVVIKSDVTGKTHYICVPIKNQVLTEKYWQLLSLFDLQMSKSYAYAMSVLYTETMSSTKTK